MGHINRRDFLKLSGAILGAGLGSRLNLEGKFPVPERGSSVDWLDKLDEKLGEGFAVKEKGNLKHLTYTNLQMNGPEVSVLVKFEDMAVFSVGPDFLAGRDNTRWADPKNISVVEGDLAAVDNAGNSYEFLRSGSIWIQSR